MAVKKPLTQTEMIRRLVESTGLKKADVVNLLRLTAELAGGELRRTGVAIVPGFGMLVKAPRRGRMVRHPATGERLEISTGRAVKFRFSKRFLAALAGDPVTELDP